jgi:ABC-type sugar transport system permease subunit
LRRCRRRARRIIHALRTASDRRPRLLGVGLPAETSKSTSALELALEAGSSALPRPSLRTRLDAFAGHAYVAPALLVFGFFLAFPVAFAVWLAFHEWNGLTPLGQAPNIGFANFRALLHDPIFRKALANTALFAAASTIVQMVIAFVLAFTLWFYKLRFSTLFRAVYFFPTVLSMVMVGLTWRQMLNPGGPIDGLLSGLGLGHVDWLSQPNLVMWVVIWVSSWQWSGWTMVLMLAGMLGIPNELVEASKIDGAGSFGIARTIVLPLIRHVTGLALLLNVIGGFQVFDTIYVLTGGGPNHASEVLGTYSYWEAFGNYGPGELGYASAMAVVMVLVLFVFSYTRIRMSRLV